MSRVSENLADTFVAALTDNTSTADATAFAEGTTWTAAEKAAIANAVVKLISACKAAGVLKSSA
jgi:hypothetical protein